MIFGDAVILGSGGGETASILAIGDVLETDTVYAEKGGKHINGVWKREANPAWLNLPSVYQQIEYLQSSGTQYIDTNHSLNLNSDIIAYKMSWVNYTSDVFDKPFGATDSNATGAFQQSSKNGIQRLMFGKNATDGSQYETALEIGKIYDVEFGKSGGRINNETFTLDAGYTAQISRDVFLFCTNSDNTAKQFAFVRFYNFTIKNNGGTLVRNFIPCYRKSDHKPGMYDTINGVFYVNQGTGADFTVGADVLQYIDGFEVKNIREYGTWTLTVKQTNRADIVRNVLIDAAELFTVEV